MTDQLTTPSDSDRNPGRPNQSQQRKEEKKTKKEKRRSTRTNKGQLDGRDSPQRQSSTTSTIPRICQKIWRKSGRQKELFLSNPKILLPISKTNMHLLDQGGRNHTHRASQPHHNNHQTLCLLINHITLSWLCNNKK